MRAYSIDGMYVNNIVAGGINPRISGDDGTRRLQKVHPAIDLGADCGWLIGPRKCWPSATAEAVRRARKSEKKRIEREGF